ncbi:uncharacterized protein LOC118200741 isoform X5 [Stegodyphus dumicola]|uniref:uncharacterized protein LOC118200741 isoform X5 n=1 Tax=Stegodyphus dumicola TaxID=202533 RepID=UPI0015B0C69E|nr:uncharacterized protein LOC118200741 isoform X5 [Stegodyphus dumicola]
MNLISVLIIFLISTVSQANDIAMMREEEELEDKAENKEENIAFESFGSPVYGPNEIVTSGSGKSGYTLPIPPTFMPASYSAYITALGLGPSFSRYGIMPTPVPAAYAASYNGLAPYMSSIMTGLGNNAYGNLPFARFAYGGYPFGYPSYANQAYRYTDVGYAPASVKSAAAPVPVPVAPTARAPFPTVDTKDASLRYGYGPAIAQRLTFY